MYPSLPLVQFDPEEEERKTCFIYNDKRTLVAVSKRMQLSMKHLPLIL